MAAATVLVVDDEQNILTSVSRALGLEGYDVEVAETAEVALEMLACAAALRSPAAQSR